MTTPTGNTAVYGMARLLFSRKEVALLLNLSTRQVTRLISNERLRIVRVGSRTLVHRDEVVRFAQNVQPYTGPRS
jgi:excisionase family DNA binding protein